MKKLANKTVVTVHIKRKGKIVAKGSFKPLSLFSCNTKNVRNLTQNFNVKLFGGKKLMY